MPGEIKLKPCPFCGRDAKIVESFDALVGCKIFMVRCCGTRKDNCTGTKTRLFSSKDVAVAAWNRRAPEPGTSVIRWTRYDGTPETLPEREEMVLLSFAEDDWDSCTGSLDVDYKKWIRDRTMAPHEVIDDVKIGQMWARMPKPEGMELAGKLLK